MHKSSSYKSSRYGLSSTRYTQQEQQPFFSKASPQKLQAKEDNNFFQPKLNVGEPGDMYEQEADRMADAVVNKHPKASPIEKQPERSIQRLATPEDHEKIGTNDERMKRDRELRMKPQSSMSDGGNKEDMDTVKVQKKDEDKEKKTLQNKASGSGKGKAVSSPALSKRISDSGGKGSKMPPGVLSEMQASFGADFSTVNIHTGADAAEMSRELGAQAFTFGNDVYFNEGKFDPSSRQGKHLLAHELTHVVQQSGGIRRQQMPGTATQPQRITSLTNGALLDEIHSIQQNNNASSSGSENSSERLNVLLQERSRRAAAGQEWLLDPSAGISSQQLYQVADHNDLIGFILVSSEQMNNATGAFRPANSVILTQTQLNNSGNRFRGRILPGIPAAASTLPGLQMTIVPPEMITMYHGTLQGATSIRTGGINVASSDANQDFGQGFYTSEDVAVGERYSRGRLGTGTGGENMMFRMPVSQLGQVVDIRAGGAQYQLFQEFLRLPINEVLANAPDHPMFSVSVREFYTGNINNFNFRGEIFENFLQRNGLQNADVIIGPLGDEIFTGITSGEESTQMSIRNQRVADLLNRSMRGDNFGEYAAPRMPSIPQGAAISGATGGIIAVLIQGTVVMIDTNQHPNWRAELAQAGFLGTGSGAVGGAVDTAIASNFISNGGSVVVGRVLGGGGAGAIAAPVFVLGSMALSDQHYTPVQYAAKGARATVSGGLSGAISAGLVTAIWGTEVPILGNIIGFGIGVGAYYLVDSLTGDSVESAISGGR